MLKVNKTWGVLPDRCSFEPNTDYILGVATFTGSGFQIVIQKWDKAICTIRQLRGFDLEGDIVVRKDGVKE